MPKLRRATDDDQPAIRTLIDGVYREYGDRLFVEGADSDLLDLEANYFLPGGQFQVLEDAPLDSDRQILGTVAVVPQQDPGVCKLHRLYLAPTLRGSGWGARLMDWALDWAAENKMTQMVFWSDTRFERAHSFYLRYGFEQGELRSMTDGAAPYQEYFFSRNLK